ncbi:MAG: tripartite tricarboxylate transporter substrate binding protein [Burkholderiales bacterium]|nr:tripartite tricarboxylate transporter substrate binding protein [Burkholderiales bacterium]MCE7877609.1 tripartite tricarboxylate transporter substrate binding protein [Betaproteobacteria bacterium PRO3]
MDGGGAQPAQGVATVSRRDLLCWGLAGTALALARGAGAQAFPGRPVRLVVPFAAGGPADTLARATATALAAQLEGQVLVENKPGAGGNIAAAYVAGSPPDGHTLLVAGQAILAINKALYASLSYDPEKDFAWVGMMGSFPNVLVSNPEAVPARSLAELLDLARARPGQISYGSNGIGSQSHLTVEVMAQVAGVKFLHVPYQGAAPQRADLLSGRIGFSFIGASTTVPLVRSGQLRALAVSTGTRVAVLPDAPTLVESGFPTLDTPTWFAAVAPAATPAPMLSALRKSFGAAIATSAYAAELSKQASLVANVDAQAAEGLLARERKVWSDAVRMTGASAG